MLGTTHSKRRSTGHGQCHLQPCQQRTSLGSSKTPDYRDIVRHKTVIQLRIYNRYQLAHTEWGACAEEEMVSEKGQTVLAFVEFTVHVVITLAFADIIQRITQINEILKL